MSLQDDNYYRILDIPEDASFEEIRRAYELASQTFKVDSLATYSLYSEEESEQILREITQAYVTLSDPITRSHYDQKRNKQTPPALSVQSETSEIEHSPPIPSVPATKKPLQTEAIAPNSEEHPEAVLKAGSVKESSDFKTFSEFIKEHLATRSHNRKTISQKNKDTHKDVQDFLATVEVYNGRILKQIRELKTIGLAEVSQEICVRQTYLLAIENEEHSKLPTPTIYVKNFINSYARCLELPAQKVLEDYLRLYEAWHHQS